jgi:hypothetical protein
MKKIIAGLALTTGFISCRNNDTTIVSNSFVDSLISNYGTPAAVKANAEEVAFWQKRIDPKQIGFTNELKYATSLAERFHLTGDIHDLKTADSILLLVDSVYAHKEAAPVLSLARHYMLEHRFQDARTCFLKAAALGLKPYDYYCTSFDVNFELGHYTAAQNDLKAISDENDYGLQFRFSKLKHLDGKVDEALEAMQNAAELGKSNVGLQQAALSNTADLFLHNGNLEKANEAYMQSIRLSSTDLHSILGLAWIALLHDRNDSLAEKICRFVAAKTTSPEPLFKLLHVAEFKNDIELQKKYAADFALKATDSLYGGMYNKYLLDAYTGILNKSAAAETLAEKELLNRGTPQTYSWYAYALFKNNKPAAAFKIYQQHVSAKPLETLELYWMGKMMQGMNKGYNAKAFFDAAYRNRFDLSPAKMQDLEKLR